MRIILKNADFSANNINPMVSITLNLTGVVTDSEVTSVKQGTAYSATFLVGSGYTYSSTVITIGGVAVTDCYSLSPDNDVIEVNISASELTGDVVITIVATEASTSYDGSATVSAYDGTVPEMTYVDPATVENAYDGSVEVEEEEAEPTGYTVTVTSNYAVTVYDNTTEVGTVSAGGSGSFTITSGTMYVYQASGGPVGTHTETGGVTHEEFTANDTTFNDALFDGGNVYVTRYAVTGDGSTSITYSSSWE